MVPPQDFASNAIAKRNQSVGIRFLLLLFLLQLRRVLLQPCYC